MGSISDFELMPGATSWKAFLRYAAQKKDLTGTSARLIMKLGGEGPARVREILEREERVKNMTDSQIAIYHDALIHLEEVRKRKTGNFITPTRGGGWEPIKGGHRKVTVLGE